MLHIRTQYSGSVAEIAKGHGSSTRWMRGLIKNAYTAMLDFWHKKIRPKHFEVTALAEYGYTPRTAAHNRKKKKAEGHRRPLVLSGESLRATERNYITVTGRGASLHMGAGNLLWPTKGNRINMREELIATTDSDEAAMARVGEASMHEQLSRSSARYFTNIK